MSLEMVSVHHFHAQLVNLIQHALLQWLYPIDLCLVLALLSQMSVVTPLTWRE